MNCRITDTGAAATHAGIEVAPGTYAHVRVAEDGDAELYVCQHPGGDVRAKPSAEIRVGFDVIATGLRDGWADVVRAARTDAARLARLAAGPLGALAGALDPATPDAPAEPQPPAVAPDAEAPAPPELVVRPEEQATPEPAPEQTAGDA